MTEELPPLVFLDMAAKGNDYADWSHVLAATANFSRLRNAIIAHARTLEITREALRLLNEHAVFDGQTHKDVAAFLAKHEPDIVPVDPDVLALAKLLGDTGYIDPRGATFERLTEGRITPTEAAALAQFKAELAGRK